MIYDDIFMHIIVEFGMEAMQMIGGFSRNDQSVTCLCWMGLNSRDDQWGLRAATTRAAQTIAELVEITSLSLSTYIYIYIYINPLVI